MSQGYKHVSDDERVEIEKGVDAGESDAVIGVRIGRHRSTVWRERKRNAWRPGNESAAYTPYRGQGYRRAGTGLQYRAGPAGRAARARSVNSHAPRKLVGDAQVGWVCRMVKEEGWTPAQVAGRSKLDFPGDPSMWVSHETVYAWAYRKDQAHHRIPEYLPRGHKIRRKRPGRRVHSSRIDRRESISTRPPEVAARDVFGHWEGDTVEGLRSVGDGIHTETERVTRFTLAVKVEAVTSAAASAAQLAMFARLPAHARRSTTLDNGRENHLHHRLTDGLGMATWFAHPYSSFERGTNEHFNGQIRRWLPKGTDLTDVSEEDLAWVLDKVNGRPLKCLGWHTPAEAFGILAARPDQPLPAWASPDRDAAPLHSPPNVTVALPT